MAEAASQMQMIETDRDQYLLKKEPYYRTVADEVDKFEQWAGREAGPVELVWKRLRSYEDRKLQLNISTPTTRFGKIFQLFEGSDYQLFFMVPCPHCKKRQRLLGK